MLREIQMKELYRPIVNSSKRVADGPYDKFGVCVMHKLFVIAQMALLPAVHSLIDDVERSLFDQNFGLGLSPDMRLQSLLPRLDDLYRPLQYLTPAITGFAGIEDTKDAFKVNLDVQQFRPEEINVKVANNNVIVEAKHEERPDEHGYISRHMQRRYLLPKDVDAEAVQTRLSSDGVLTVIAPKKALPPTEGNERVIPVVQTGAPAIKAARRRQ